MTKKIHTQSKIFFPNPTVVRLDHTIEGVSIGDASQTNGYMTTLKMARKRILGTWGYSPPMIEAIPHPAPQLINGVPHVTIDMLFGDQSRHRSYWCFEDEMDALQFKIAAGDNSHTVSMWPNKVLFTIYEYTKDES